MEPLLPYSTAALQTASHAIRTHLHPPLPFTVCVSDFGESTMYTKSADSYEIANKGTQFIKSPEMLEAPNMSNVSRYYR
jgi:hypothetical protein